MGSATVTLVGGVGHSNPTEAVVAQIAPEGNVFSGTFTGRSSHSVDFVLGVYTDKTRRLHLSLLSSETTLVLTRVDNLSWNVFWDTKLLGIVSFDAATGNLCIVTAPSLWFQGEVQGSFVQFV